ncbi:MAG: glycosyltransferase family 39 protein [Saprospiraceae bacterium]
MLNSSTQLFFILLLGFLLRLVVVQTPFLGEWDERFHALVAKNLMEHPLKPTLYDDPVLPYDYREWSANHVWLSKPPLALWLMAGSMSLLGTGLFALRLPALLVSLASVYLTFLIGRRLFDTRTALTAALLHAIHGMTWK